MLSPARSMPKPRKKRRVAVHSRRRAGRGCMARSPRQRSVGASAQLVPKSSAASGKAASGSQTPRSVAEMAPAPNPVHRTMKVTQATRIARASVGKRARRRRQMQSGDGTSHQSSRPTAASIDRPVMYMTVGITQITNSAHPACPMAKLTRSRRPAADARAARNTSLTAAELARASEGVLRAVAVADSEGEVAALWTTLDSASTPRRRRRQPARPRSSRLGSRAMAAATAKAIAIRRRRSLARASSSSFSAFRSSKKAAEALPLAHRQGIGGSEYTLASHAIESHCPVPAVARHAAVPTRGGAEPRLVLVEPEPQIVCGSSELGREGVLLHRADAGRYAPVVFAEVHAAEERGGALGRHAEAGGITGGAGE
eukprot:scaffold3802_cov67-Phaeocystis_antarctica.AAC.1